MRHGKRHASFAVSTVLGLTAPALAAVLLTSSVPTQAAPAPAAVVNEEPASLHVPVFAPSAPASPVAKVAAKAAVKPVVAPAAKPAAPRTARVAAKPAPAPKTAAPTAVRSPAPKATTSGSTSTAQPKGIDDYKWKNSTDYYAVDTWDFTQRQCVSFAAWRLAQHGRSMGAHAGATWGSALKWDDTARSLGKTVTSKPRVGAIAQWNAGEGSQWYSTGASKPNGTFSAGSYGHVGWVKLVYADGSALVEQYNMGNSRSYSVMRVKAPRYLYL